MTVIEKQAFVTVEKEKTKTVVVGQQGPIGPQGPQGNTGPGVSQGGGVGSALVKKSAIDFDTEWTTDPLGDAAFKNVGTGPDDVAAGDDARFSDAREWTADTVSKADAEAGTSQSRKAWNAERVKQAIFALFAPAISAVSSKTTPADNDLFGIVDSADSNKLKKLTFANLWNTLKAKIQGTAFTFTEDQTFEKDIIGVVDASVQNSTIQNVEVNADNVFIPYLENDLANNLVLGGTATVTAGSMIGMLGNIFSPDLAIVVVPQSGSVEITIEFWRTFSHYCEVGFITHKSFTANYFKLELCKPGDVWETVYEGAEAGRVVYRFPKTNSTPGYTKMRLTVDDVTVSTGCRISQIFLNNYAGEKSSALFARRDRTEIFGTFFKNTRIQPRTGSYTIGASELGNSVLLTIAQYSDHTFTLPAGASMDAPATILTPRNGQSAEWHVRNDSASGKKVTIATNTGHTFVGDPDVLADSMASFLTVRTDTATWVTYRKS